MSFRDGRTRDPAHDRTHGGAVVMIHRIADCRADAAAEKGAQHGVRRVGTG
jgi:hypothetical protein